ncbi:MAG TPA: permease [Mycobacteriales bacterium]|nr:permease [Mycobacteriales bacterium]
MYALDTIGRSLSDGFGMFWETLWALVLGFALSGAVQAFISRSQMQRSLGDHRPRTVAKASLFGAASSSCSYAAAALAKTLFFRGADFTAAQAFMFASTNLVLELGIVMWLLIGWQFAAAEFIGGAIMIALLGLVLPRVVSPQLQEQARRRMVGGGNLTPDPEPHPDEPHPDESHPDEPQSWRHRARSLAGWSDAAGYTISDLTMLRKELVVGFVVAGIADTAVPISFWKSLFLAGHGFGSALENAVLGPFLAIISFVCSIGNVPLAAALWSSGITFGGVIAFVFADLITLPLLLIYRKYYGTRLTVRLLAVFWATMSLAGLLTEYLFKAVGIAPAPSTSGHGLVGRNVYGWNYTTVLDVVALAAFAGLYWLYRHRDRFGGGGDYAKDPVCGMQVETAHAPATADVAGERFYFCSDGCQHRFTGDRSSQGPSSVR